MALSYLEGLGQGIGVDMLALSTDPRPTDVSDGSTIYFLNHADDSTIQVYIRNMSKKCGDSIG